MSENERKLREALLGMVAITRTWQQMLLDARKVPLADLCWCGDRGGWPVEHQPYCNAARAALAVPEPAQAWPRCAICDRPATCIGAYEGNFEGTDPVPPVPSFGCDVCCGHGNEDGTCFRLPGAPAPPGAADTRTEGGK